MQGRVIYLPRPGQHDGFGHPNAVIVELGPDSFLCVAGFTPGKERYERARDAEFKLGVWGPAFAVEIDHAKHLLTSNPELDLHLCGYICQTAEVVTAGQLRRSHQWGTLSKSASDQLAEGLLARESVRRFLPRNAVVALKKLLGR